MNTKDFKTRTEMIARDNGQLQGAWLVALDIGYSAVKVYSPNSVAMFPSYAKPYTNRGTVGKLPNDFITYTDLDTNEQWLVGSMAQEDNTVNEAIDSDEALFGRQRYYDPMFKVVARVGLAMGMMPNKHGDIGGKKLYVQTGLPPKYIKDDAEPLREALAGSHHFSVKIGSNMPVEFMFDLLPENIFVIMQPMGTFYSILFDNTHKYVEDANGYLKKNILVFDAGFGTFDLFMIKNHSVKESQTFSNLGMKQVFLNTADAIRKKYGQSVGVAEMQKYLEAGTVRRFDRKNLTTEDVPFADLLESAVDKVSSEAIEKMAQVYQLQEVDYLVITGGTGAAWKDKIRSRLAGMTTLKVVDGNQNDTSLPFVFANVRGYYMYRYAIMKDGMKR